MMSKTTEPMIISKIPSATELTSPSAPIPCSVTNCGQFLTNSGTLYLHMLKHHNVDIRVPKSTDIIRYFCPEANCKYNVNKKLNGRSFASKKYLTQHYMKVHAKKSFPCSRCDKIFSSLAFKTAHETKSCGQDFICIECSWVYKSKEALMTHCRRKKHPYSKPVEDKLVNVETKYVVPSIPKKFIKIAPKIPLKFKNKSIGISMYERKKSQGTQALSNDNPKDKNFLDDWNQLAMQPSRTCQDAKINSNKPKAKAVKNDQTTNRSFRNLDIFDAESSTLMTISSYAQTDKNLNNLNYVEDDSLLYFDSDNFNTGLCHIETQTELFQENVTESTNSDQLDQLLYSNMCTQTCDDILSEFCFANIQTQTNWSTSDCNDLLVSAETQTIDSTFLLSNSSSTQTQTISSDN